MVARRAKNCTGVMGSALPNQSPGCWHFRHAGICTAIGRTKTSTSSLSRLLIPPTVTCGADWRLRSQERAVQDSYPSTRPACERKAKDSCSSDSARPRSRCARLKSRWPPLPPSEPCSQSPRPAAYHCRRLHKRCTRPWSGDRVPTSPPDGPRSDVSAGDGSGDLHIAFFSASVKVSPIASSLPTCKNAQTCAQACAQACMQGFPHNQCMACWCTRAKSWVLVHTNPHGEHKSGCPSVYVGCQNLFPCS